MKTPRILVAALFAVALAGPALADDAAFNAELLSIQQAWAKVNYETPAGDARAQAFDALEKRAEKFTQQNPTRAEALIWEGIIESSYAGAKGGLGALSLAKEARGNLEAALKINPKALDGSAYTSLGTLYYKVPGFPRRSTARPTPASARCTTRCLASRWASATTTRPASCSPRRSS